ncbi:MAG: hypothetical protein M3R60_18875 [Pseudomonadota bacterium]|nr:hypothetical protein [Pseudomonadota bacterium]
MHDGRVAGAVGYWQDYRVTPFALADANQALAALRAGDFDGAAVLVP